MAALTSSIAEASVLGSSTSTPTVRSGAEIMKMISSTSMTSTKGVTLISDRAARRRRLRPRPPLVVEPEPVESATAQPPARRRATAVVSSSAKLSRRLTNRPESIENLL